MKIALTIEGLTARQALDIVFKVAELEGPITLTESSELGDVSFSMDDALAQAESNLAAGDVVEVTPAKARKKRRTKAEMAAARGEAPASVMTDWVEVAKAEEAAKANAAMKVSEDYAAANPPQRRRKAVGEAKAAPATEAAPSGITNLDLTKAASEAARKASPDVVLGVLGQFGVANVSAIPDASRRKFLDMLKALS